MQHPRSQETPLRCPPTQRRRIEEPLSRPNVRENGHSCVMRDCQYPYMVTCCLLDFCERHYTSHRRNCVLARTSLTPISNSSTPSTSSIHITTPTTSITISSSSSFSTNSLSSPIPTTSSSSPLPTASSSFPTISSTSHLNYPPMTVRTLFPHSHSHSLPSPPPPPLPPVPPPTSMENDNGYENSFAEELDERIGHLTLPEIEQRVRDAHMFSFQVILEVKSTKSGSSVNIFPPVPIQATSFEQMRLALFNLAKPYIIGKWTKADGKPVLVPLSAEEKTFQNFCGFVKVERESRKKRIGLDQYKEAEMRNDMGPNPLILIVWKYGPQTLAGDAMLLDKACNASSTDRAGAADISYRRTLAERLKEFHSSQWVPTHHLNWMTWANVLIHRCREKQLNIDDELKHDPPDSCLHLFQRPTSSAVRVTEDLLGRSRMFSRMIDALRTEVTRHNQEVLRILNAYDTMFQGFTEDLNQRIIELPEAQQAASTITNQEDIDHQ